MRKRLILINVGNKSLVILHAKCGHIICSEVDLFKSQVIRNISLFTALYVWRNIVSKGSYILFIPQPEALRR